ncbi:hypothetical protein HPB49_006077 [Dermacentor silvarum]|uniref:Uncharacterized protein n=1 Tax=Dermacentor silvarum TaxID=543639 RepID=A0ACB8DBI9_DERSI|nr:hypothetical protein HPB49_006077 [Dermacentor silvarum]
MRIKCADTARSPQWRGVFSVYRASFADPFPFGAVASSRRRRRLCGASSSSSGQTGVAAVACAAAWNPRARAGQGALSRAPRTRRRTPPADALPSCSLDSRRPRSTFLPGSSPFPVAETYRAYLFSQNSMDLPPDKAKLLKQYDDEKKWDMICDQEKVIAKEPPSFYLRKLKTYLDPRASRSAKRRRMLGDSKSTQVLRDLEISLRTNNIEWVREFLDEQNKGLEVLIDYLTFQLGFLRYDREAAMSSTASENGYAASPVNCRKSILEADTPRLKRASRHAAKLHMGEAEDDIHVCIMCLRAIMNNKFGFNMVIEHTQAINSIALSLNHKSLRTKALVLELLAAICLVKGGHQIILNAFDNFKTACCEPRRFKTLMDDFRDYETFNIDFMVACMQFINIVVHSVDDMNFRVHLQYEFTFLGLDEYLERLRSTESEELKVQISAYLDNVFDVHALMEDSETKMLESVVKVFICLFQAHELENEMMAKLVELETQLQILDKENRELIESQKQTSEELNTLRKAVSEKEEEKRQRESFLEGKIQELESLTGTLPRGKSHFK